jgi:hypothetical protein
MPGVAEKLLLHKIQTKKAHKNSALGFLIAGHLYHN